MIKTILASIGLGAVVALFLFLVACVGVWLEDRKEKRDGSDKS